jgi:hypothetical protein
MSTVHYRHVQGTGLRNQNKMYIEKVKLENCLEDLGIGGTILLKRIVDKKGAKCGLQRNDSG